MTTNFKTVADFFCTAKKQDVIRRNRAEKLVRRCNSRPARTQDLYACRICELDEIRLRNWYELRDKIKRRVKGTVYEEIFRERFEKQNSYLRTATQTNQSPSSYYAKLEKLYSYIFLLACQEDLVELAEEDAG